MGPGHIGLHPGFINEIDLTGIMIQLAVEPFLPLLQNVFPVLLLRVSRLFLRVIL